MIACLLFAFLADSSVSEDPSSSERVRVASDTAADVPLQHPFDEAETLILERTNAFRTERERDSLTRDPKLDLTAQWFANFMAEHSQYGHQADGREPAERIEAHGYDFCAVGENIAWVQQGLQEIAAEDLGHELFTGWRDSPPHRENILNGSFTQIGLGLARASSGRYYGVQLFGRPSSLRFSFQIENASDDSQTYTVDESEYELPPRAIMTHTACDTVTFGLPSIANQKVGQPTRLVLTRDGSDVVVRNEEFKRPESTQPD